MIHIQYTSIFKSYESKDIQRFQEECYFHKENIIKAIDQPSKESTIDDIGSSYLFWKASLPFNKTYWFDEPFNEFQLTTSYWNYLYENFDEFQAIIIGSIDHQNLSISNYHGEQIITNITSSHAQLLLQKIK